MRSDRSLDVGTTYRSTFSDPVNKTRRGRLDRQRSVPTSAGRRSQPQCKEVFKLEKLPTGSYITVPRQGELAMRRRHSTGGFDDHNIKSMRLTSDMSTLRRTGPSEANVSFRQPAQEQWMRGNTRRFGNTGQWVANRSPAVGAAPGLCSQQQFGSQFMGGAQSHNAETYRQPYNDDSAAPDFGHNTLRLKHEQAPSGAAPPPLDASDVLVNEQAEILANDWIAKASKFEQDIVTRMMRDVNAKLKHDAIKAW